MQPGAAYFFTTPRGKTPRAHARGVSCYCVYFSGICCSSQRALQASEGILCPSRGESVKPITAGPSAEALRLNCWAKNLRQ